MHDHKSLKTSLGWPHLGILSWGSVTVRVIVHDLNVPFNLPGVFDILHSVFQSFGSEGKDHARMHELTFISYLCKADLFGVV